MFEELFVKTSDLVFHNIAPYAVERERFLEHCCEEGFSKAALRRIAGIVVTAGLSCPHSRAPRLAPHQSLATLP